MALPLLTSRSPAYLTAASPLPDEAFAPRVARHKMVLLLTIVTVVVVWSLWVEDVPAGMRHTPGSSRLAETPGLPRPLPAPARVTRLPIGGLFQLQPVARGASPSWAAVQGSGPRRRSVTRPTATGSNGRRQQPEVEPANVAQPNATRTTVLLWLRKGLRLHDNPALVAAVAEAAARGGPLVPVFCLHPAFVASGRVGPLRWRFLREALVDLDAQLRAAGSALFVLRGSPAPCIAEACAAFGAAAVHYEMDTEAYAIARDAAVTDQLLARNISVNRHAGHTLHDMDALRRRCPRGPPLTYRAFRKLLDEVGPPAMPVKVPLQALRDLQPPPWAAQYGVPSAEALGAAPGPGTLFPGGERAAVARLHAYLSDEAAVCGFRKPDTDPTALAPSTTALSPYLKFGCLSPRTVYWAVDAVYRRCAAHTQPPQSLHGQLLFREWFHLLSYVTPNWERMEGNALCRQIPWDWDPAVVRAWEEGRTGYPWIDAVMNQLRTEGWMHHLARHCVACFLTRGDLWQHWEAGAAVFEFHLLDADWAINTANWYWLSASALFHQYHRVYSPVTFAAKYDPEGAFVRRYVPALRHFPAAYIYRPWEAPLAVQEEAGCIIGRDYPMPIVDHATARAANLARMKEAYRKYT